jgi:hypothetical protein
MSSSSMVSMRQEQEQEQEQQADYPTRILIDFARRILSTAPDQLVRVFCARPIDRWTTAEGSASQQVRPASAASDGSCAAAASAAVSFTFASLADNDYEGGVWIAGAVPPVLCPCFRLAQLPFPCRRVLRGGTQAQEEQAEQREPDIRHMVHPPYSLLLSALTPTPPPPPYLVQGR